MRYEDILVLAKAGFTAQQIAQMSIGETKAEPEHDHGQAVPVPDIPAPAPVPAPVSAPVPENAPELPKSDNPVQPTGLDAVLAQMAALTKAVQVSNINNSAQPHQQEMTIDDVMASVINPTKK